MGASLVILWLFSRAAEFNRSSSLKDFRRAVAGWHHTNVIVPHVAVRGVSQFHLQLNDVSRTTPLTAVPTPEIAPRDVSMVLSIKSSSRQIRAPPKHRHAKNLECRNEGSEEHPVYHGGGWLPAIVTKQTRILTPSLFAPKGH
jgi:hypothetical protein